MLGTYHLTGLFDILREIHFVYDPKKLWSLVLEKACKIVQAEAGSFYLVLPSGTEMQLTSSFGIDEKRLNQVPFRVGVGLCGWVAQFQQPAIVNDVRQDNRFNGAADVLTGFKTKSLLCVPVFSQNRTYGVLEVINKKTGLFSPQDQEFMTLLARQTAVAYQNLQLISEVTHAKTLLESLIGSLSGGLIAIDATHHVTLINPAACHLLDLKDPVIVGKEIGGVLGNYPDFNKILLQTLETKSTVSRQELQLTIAGANTRVGYSTILVTDQQKTILGAGIIFQKLSS